MRFGLLVFVFFSAAVFAQRTEADLKCRHSAKDYIYDCVIRLSRGGEPLAGAQVSVGADMPSMPMAHNIKPVKARPAKNPGEYEARLDLEMPGEWAVKLRISGPVRDQVVKKMHFH
jgi:hypothetical protein